MAITGKAISELTLATSLSTGSYFPVVDPTLGAGSKNVRVTVDGLSKNLVNVTYLTGNQTISGVKTFSSRPTVNGSGVLLVGEATSASVSGAVYTTGDQTVSGNKTFTGISYFNSGAFSNRPTVNGVGVLLVGEATSASVSGAVYTTGDQTVSGVKTFAATGYFLSGLIVSGSGLRVSGAASFSQRQTVNGTGVLLVGEATSTSASVTGAVYTTGDQTVSGVKTFVGTGYFLSGLIVSGNGLMVSGAASFSQRPFVNGTGVLLSGEATSSTISNVVYTTGDQTISGIKTFTGVLNAATGNFSSGLFVSGVSVLTGSYSKVSVTGSSVVLNPSFSGIGGTQVILSGQNVLISGSSGPVTNNNNTFINSGTGLFIYRSGISSGVSEQFFKFPAILDARPIVIASLHNDVFNDILAYQISGANTSGFWGLFSESVANTGYYFDIMASNSSTTGMATIVIGGSTVSSSTWSSLTWGTGTTWAASSNVIEDKAILVMTGNSTLSITNLYNGWAGVLQVIQSGNSSSGYLLTAPASTRVANAGSGIFSLTRVSGAIDMIGFEYDGSRLFASVGNNYN